MSEGKPDDDVLIFCPVFMLIGKLIGFLKNIFPKVEFIPLMSRDVQTESENYVKLKKTTA